MREVESSLATAGRPDRGGVLRRRQHDHPGRLDLPPGPRAAPAASSSRPGTSSARPGSRRTSGSSASRTPSTSPTPATRRSRSSRGTGSRSSRRSARRSSTRRWPSGSGPAPGRSPRCTSTRASGSGWSPRRPIEIARTIARRLGLTGALGTVAEHEDGVYTGRLVGDLLHGAGQGRGGAALAEREGLDLGRCSAYSDSHNDLPMLIAGRRPVRDQPRLPAARPRPRRRAGGSATTAPAARRRRPGCSPPAWPAPRPARWRPRWRSASAAGARVHVTV